MRGHFLCVGDLWGDLTILSLSPVNEKCGLPSHQTKDAVAINLSVMTCTDSGHEVTQDDNKGAAKPSATVPSPVVHHEGTQDGKEQDTGPR